MKKKIIAICIGFLAILAIYSGCLKQTEEIHVNVKQKGEEF